MSSEVLAVLLYRLYLLYWLEMLWVDLNQSPGTASDVNPVKSGTHFISYLFLLLPHFPSGSLEVVHPSGRLLHG